MTIRLHLLDWYSRKHTRVVRSTFAAELLSLLDAVNQGHVIKVAIDELHLGTRSAKQLLEQQARAGIPLDAGVDAKSVYDSLTADVVRTPNDKQLLLHAKAMRELLEDGQIDRLFWFDTEDMLPDGLTKGSVDREPLMRVAAEGEWAIKHDAPVWKTLRKEAYTSRRLGDSDIPRVYSIGFAETCVPVPVNNVPTYVPVTVNNAQQTSVAIPISWQKQPDESPLGSITCKNRQGPARVRNSL
jgi:hypothetical protein